MVFLSIVSLVSIFTSSLKSFYYDEKVEDLFARAKFFSNYINQDNINSNQALNDLCIKIGNETKTRITIIDYQGNVLGDSDKNPSTMNKHTGDSRDEIKIAKESNQFGSSVRYKLWPCLDHSNLLSSSKPKNITYVIVWGKSGLPLDFTSTQKDEIKGYSIVDTNQVLETRWTQIDYYTNKSEWVEVLSNNNIRYDK